MGRAAGKSGLLVAVQTPMGRAYGGRDPWRSGLIFVGIPTGSWPNHYGDTRTLTLPETAIEVEISELFWQQSDPRDDRPWITPDLPATPSMRDRLDGRDPALEAALAYEPPASFAESFGPPLSRWQRANQLSDESWPELLEPAARSVAATADQAAGSCSVLPCGD